MSVKTKAAILLPGHDSVWDARVAVTAFIVISQPMRVVANC